MLFKASVTNERRTDYEGTAWEPQVELLQPPPRSVSFGARFKVAVLVVILVTTFMFGVAILPWLKHAYITSYGVAARGTIELRYTQKYVKRRTNSYFVVVRYDTPSGQQLVRLQASYTFYTRNLQAQTVPLHFLPRFPSQCVLDGDETFRPWPALIVLGVWGLSFGLQFYFYLKMRSLVVLGTPVKGLITDIPKGVKTRYFTIYYEFQGTPCAGQFAVRPNRAKAAWQVGKAITLLVSGSSDDSRGAQAVMTYPDSAFKVDQ